MIVTRGFGLGPFLIILRGLGAEQEGVDRYVVLDCSEVIQANNGYQVTLTIVETVGVEKELFVFRRTVPGGLIRQNFSHVASPQDLLDYPVYTLNSSVMYTRRNETVLVYRDVLALKQGLEAIKHDICSLIESLNQAEQLREASVII
jgi:hypothetical protein